MGNKNSRPEDPQGRALRLACEKGRIQEVTAILDSGCNINDSNQFGTTALHEACTEGHGSIVRLLVTRGARVTAQSEDGVTPLHMAITGGYLNIIKYLLDENAMVVSLASNQGWTPLHLAMSQNMTKIAITLLAAGADHTAVNKNGKAPLDLVTNDTARDNLRAHIEYRDSQPSEPAHEPEPAPSRQRGERAQETQQAPQYEQEGRASDGASPLEMSDLSDSDSDHESPPDHDGQGDAMSVLARMSELTSEASLQQLSKSELKRLERFFDEHLGRVQVELSVRSQLAGGKSTLPDIMSL